MMSSLCLFCRIIEHQIPAKIIAETKDVLAFHDIAPVAPVHILIVPKVHVASINDVDAKNAFIFSPMILMAQQLAQELAVDNSGFRLVINTQKAAGQTIDHVHMHLMGGRSLSWPPG